MKKLLSFIICIIFTLSLTACGDDTIIVSSTPDETAPPTVSEISDDALPIVGTWVCDDINEECYFIFEENGDAFAKWGTSTVYGYYDYYEEDNVYDIDVPNFLYNEYEATFKGDKMTLESEESNYTFDKATMPKVTIKAPDNLAIDEKLIGNWQSADSYECYEFRADGTATITDLYNYATIESKFSCDKGVVTFYYMSSATKDGSRESEYSFTKDGKLTLTGFTYENVTGQTS